MNFDQLEHIVTVANEKSITKAADKLYISTSGLSQSITQLEMELGIKIFNRSKKNITPTFEGEIVISTASTILKNISEMHYKLKNDNEFHLKIYLAPTFYHLLQEFIVKFHLEKKDLTFELVEKNPIKILENFNKENYDFALIPATLEDLKKVQNISFKHIYKGHICIAVGKNSPFYSLDFVTLKDIENAKLVVLETADKNQIIKYTKINPEQVIMSSSRSDILLKLVKQSEAILYLHDFTLKNFPMVLSGDLKVIPLMDDEKLIELDFWIIYLESKGLSNLANEFLEGFKEHFNKYI